MRASSPVLLAVALALASQTGVHAETAAVSPQPGYVATQADEAATLLADRIELTASDQLIAEGSVEVFWKQNRLTASRIVYDKQNDKLTISGPIRLVQPGQTGSVIVAESAELSRDLQNGILIGARMVMARELQLAANRIERKDGVVTTLSEVVASSCRVCANDPTPLWEIRARRITHDANRQQMFFDGAQFRAMGVPLFWFPHLRLPDPTVKRMTGFLQPSFRSTSSLGPGLKVPYFITLGDSADLTITPYLASAHTSTLDLRYRRALSFGTFSIEGAASRDSIRPGETRGYLFSDARFSLPREYQLDVQLRLVSDPSYLLNYGISDDDRLWSGVTLQRVKRDDLFWFRAGNTHSLRSNESNTTQPMLSGDFDRIRVIRPAGIGGEMTLDWALHGHRRSSDASTDGSDADTISDGRDMMRASFVADWRRNWQLPAGMLAATEAQLAFDATAVRQDEDYAGNDLNTLPTFAAELRWPWIKTSGRAAQIIEPIAQIVWSPNDLPNTANEDSWLTELDEGNLFSLSRYPGEDAREQGLRANLGLSWTRQDASGWSLNVMGGRIVRAEDLGQFTTGSGLAGKQSDWLLATHLRSASGFLMSNRALFDDAFAVSREELRLGYDTPDYQIAAGYLWMEANAAESRTTDISELLLETSWDWADGWGSSFNTRYDFTAERAAKAAFGLQYSNECVTVDLSLSRRFTSSTSVKPETSFGLQVTLAGFGGSAASNAAQRVCRN